MIVPVVMKAKQNGERCWFDNSHKLASINATGKFRRIESSENSIQIQG